MGGAYVPGGTTKSMQKSTASAEEADESFSESLQKDAGVVQARVRWEHDEEMPSQQAAHVEVQVLRGVNLLDVSALVIRDLDTFPDKNLLSVAPRAAEGGGSFARSPVDSVRSPDLRVRSPVFVWSGGKDDVHVVYITMYDDHDDLQFCLKWWEGRTMSCTSQCMMAMM